MNHNQSNKTMNPDPVNNSRIVKGGRLENCARNLLLEGKQKCYR